MVNAPHIARERNIAVSETRHERRGDYQSLISLTVTTERRSRSVAGTLFAESRPRLVRIKDIEIEAELGPHMLYITNRDTPGIIGHIGTTLARAGVNIATFHLGRSEQGGDAIALIEIDSEPETGLLDRITALPHVLTVVAMKF